MLIADCSTASQFNNPQKKYEQTLGNKVLIHMDIETMFPSGKLRDLAKAAGKGKIAVIDELISEGVDVNSLGAENATALFWSMRNEEGFNHLLTKGADPNVVFGDGGSVMHWAARNQKDCSLLVSALNHGGNPNLKAGMFGGSPTFSTISAGKNSGVPKCLKILLSNEADIEFRDERGKTLLLYSAGIARFDIALFLLDQGADATVEDNKGKNMSSILDSYKDAFKQGSVTESNWLKLRERLGKFAGS